MQLTQKFLDNLGQAKGHLTLIITDVKDGHIKEQFDFDNLLVTALRVQVLHALGNDGGVIASYKVDRMSMGTGSTAAAITDDNIETPTVPPTNMTISAYSYPDSHRIRFTAGLGAAEGNGNAYREIGLFMANNWMLSRRVFSGVRTKDADSVWTFYWTIRFIPP